MSSLRPREVGMGCGSCAQLKRSRRSKACVNNMKKLLSTFPLTFYKKTLAKSGLLDVEIADGW